VTDVIAHRGASRLARENTIDAFRLAVQVGAQGVELDARRSADDVVVVHHDARLADGRVIADTPWRDLPGDVPTLGAALDACAGAWVNIEIKNSPQDPDFDPDDRVAVEVLAHLAERSEGRWLLSSFRLETIDRCRAVAPDVPTAWLTVMVDEGTPRLLRDRGHVAVHPHVLALDAAAIARCHEVGILVNGWTCNDPDQFLRLAAWGVDGLCTDIPDIMVAALAVTDPD
jgi:glycerophosphoryl diester phosphodiesterase